MSKYLNFQDDPQTKTDDFLYKMQAWESMVATIGGIFLHFTATVAPVIILLSNVPIEAKLAAVGGGIAGNFTGLGIVRYSPNRKEKGGNHQEKSETPSIEDTF